jgi:hypothetical protein
MGTPVGAALARSLNRDSSAQTALPRLPSAGFQPHVSAMAFTSIRPRPLSSRFHLGMLSGSFVILRFPLNGARAESEPPTIYADLFTGALYLDKPHEVARYTRAFAEIWQASLDIDSSRDLIRQAAEELNG